MDRSLIRHTIDSSKDYLLRIVDPEMHGFSKRYDVARGGFDDRLRTIYTSSSLYTLMAINELAYDPTIEKKIRPIADFILAMQKEGEPYAGAFYYSYDRASGQKERRLPVGTTAKTIMTFVRLYDEYGDGRYLDAAEKAGTWLLTMQRPDGSFPVGVDWKNEAWHVNPSFSLFYNCQVLTALSRLYRISENPAYYEAAKKTAMLLLQMIEDDGYYLRDEYRPKVRSVSTSWLAMALLDFSRIHPDKRIENVAFACMGAVIAHQLKDPSDLYDYGRFDDTSATSGNGWINEVNSEIYKACTESRRPDCEKYRRSLILTSRWLIQNTYSAENAFNVKSPERVIGGLIRNRKEQAIRTDAVCHGVNSLIGLLRSTDAEVLFPLQKRVQPLNKVSYSMETTKESFWGQTPLLLLLARSRLLAAQW